MPIIRRVGPNAAATIAAQNAHVQGWHAAHYPDRFRADPDQTALTAYFADRLADSSVHCFSAGDPVQGYALCVLVDRAASAFSPAIRRVLIEHIAVAPDARRQGLGRALMQAARDLARSELCDEVVLDTWALSHDAHRFFEKQGFAVQRMLYVAKP